MDCVVMWLISSLSGLFLFHSSPFPVWMNTPCGWGWRRSYQVCQFVWRTLRFWPRNPYQRMHMTTIHLGQTRRIPWKKMSMHSNGMTARGVWHLILHKSAKVTEEVNPSIGRCVSYIYLLLIYIKMISTDRLSHGINMMYYEENFKGFKLSRNVFDLARFRSSS